MKDIEEYLREKIAALVYEEEYAQTQKEILDEAIVLFPDRTDTVYLLYQTIVEELTA